MNQEIKQEWLTALRSGEYKQGTGQLRNANNEFCCLGVLCDIISKEFPDDYHWKNTILFAHKRTGEKTTAFLPPSIENMMGITENNDFTLGLAHLNDVKKYDFLQIANHIESYIPIAPLEGNNYD